MFNILANAGDLLSPGKMIGMPENYSAHGSQVDHLIDVIQWFMIALFVGWTLFFLLCLFKFHRRKNPNAQYHGVKNHVSTHLEIGVVIVEAVLLLGFALPMWSDRTDDFKTVEKQDPVRVRAIGYQFGWTYHYAGADGKFGRIDRSLVSKKGDACIDYEDPNAADDFIVEGGALRLPVGRPAIVQVTATDVIHNYSIIPMRIQQDAIPGTDIPMWFTPTREIETWVVCGQLCGKGHGDMTTRLKVEKKASFNKWFDGEVAAAKKASAKRELARKEDEAKEKEARIARIEANKKKEETAN